jgi:hypothetical protein
MGMPQVLRHVVETQRGVRRDVREKAGLTLYDVFFTETSRVNQVRVLVAPPPPPPLIDAPPALARSS